MTEDEERAYSVGRDVGRMEMREEIAREQLNRPSPATDAGLDVPRVLQAMENLNLVVTVLDAEHEAIAAEYARLATPDKGQPSPDTDELPDWGLVR